MTTRYTKSVTVAAPLHHAFEKSMDHFQREGYLLGRAYPYRFVELTWTGTTLSLQEINAHHKLTVHLNHVGEDVVMRFEYSCPSGIGSFREWSKRTADESIAVLCNSIKTSKPRDLDPDRICVNCKEGISDDARFCTYCGHDLEGGVKG